MLKTKIKASAVANLTDARYFAARGVEWLGFRLDGGTSLLAAKAIAEWVDGVKIVGEFEFATAEEISAANEQLPFDAVQVGMFTPVAELAKLPNLTIIKEVVVEKSSSEAEIVAHLQAYSDCCSYFLLDFTKAGSDWKTLRAGGPLSVAFLKNIFSEKNCILALDFEAEETQEVLEALQPMGLSLMGGEEEKVGLKSFDELDALLDALELG